MKRFNISSISFIFLLAMNKWKHRKLCQYDSGYLSSKSIFQIFEMIQIPTPMDKIIIHKINFNVIMNVKKKKIINKKYGGL